MSKSSSAGLQQPTSFAERKAWSSDSVVLDLLSDEACPPDEIARTVARLGLLLIDLLDGGAVTVRYVERVLFNLEVVTAAERRGLAPECIELLDLGMQFEDWEEHTPDELPAALAQARELSRKILRH